MRKLLLVAAAVMVATAACTPGSTDDSGRPLGGSHTQTRKLVNQPSGAPSGSAREALIERADRAYPADSFSGVTADGSDLRIHRVPVPRVAEFDASLRRQHPELRLVFVDAPHARATLDGVAGRSRRPSGYSPPTIRSASTATSMSSSPRPAASRRILARSREPASGVARSAGTAGRISKPGVIRLRCHCVLRRCLHRHGTSPCS